MQHEQHERVFALSQLLEEQNRVTDFAASKDGLVVVLILDKNRILGADLRTTEFRKLRKFDAELECVSFSPDDDFLIFASGSSKADFSLFVAPVSALVNGEHHKMPPISVPRSNNNNNNGGKCWKSDDLTHFRVKSECGTSKPSSVLWWTNHDSRSVAFVGFDDGQISAVDVENGIEFSRFSASSTATSICRLEVIADSSLDSTYLIISGRQNGKRVVKQWRLLLEQLSCGFCWCAGQGTKDTAAAASGGSSNDMLLNGAGGRSRFSGLRQEFATFRQRLSESGRRMMSSMTSTDLEPDALDGAASALGLEADRPESLTSRVGDTEVSVQRWKSDTIFSGVFRDASILTVHNSALEVLPQSAFKLPRETNRVLMLDHPKATMVLVASTGQTLNLVSLHHAELNNSSSMTSSSSNVDSVLQSFIFKSGELVLGLFQVCTVKQVSNKH